MTIAIIIITIDVTITVTVTIIVTIFLIFVVVCESDVCFVLFCLILFVFSICSFVSLLCY